MANLDSAEEIRNLKHRIAQLESREDTYKRSERLLQAFNQAALAMSYATTPEEIFDTAAKALKNLDISSVIYSIDPKQENAIVNSITLESKSLKAAEKIVGFRAEGFSIPIDPVDALRISIRERRTHLSRDLEGILHQILPAHLKKFSGKLAKLLNIPTSISAPLIRGEDVIGLFSVQSNHLMEDDIPLVTAFAHQVASSWHKAQLYQQAQHEIAERIQVETKLLEEHNRTQQYLDITGVFIVALNENGEIVLLNQKGCDVLGYKEDELIGKNWFETIISEKERERVFAVFHQIMRGDVESIEYFENSVQTKNGEIRTIAWHNSLLTNDDGKIIATLSSGEDITERLLAEQALRESEERFRNIVNSSPMGMHMYQLEPDGRLIFIGSNPAADNILWVDNTQFIGRTIEEAFPALAETEIPERYRRAAADGESWQTTQITYEDDRIAGAYDVFAVQTSPGRMIAIFLDVVEQKRAIQDQERLVSILEATSDVVGTATLDGRLIYLNKAGRQMFGMKENADLQEVAQFRTRPITEYIKIQPESISAASLYGVWSGESTIVDLSNREIPVSIVLIAHRDSSGDPEFISAVIRDISDLRRAEDLIHLQSTALDAAATGIFITDKQGEIIWANTSITEITGYELDEIIGVSPEIFSSGQHESKYYQDITDTLSKGSVWLGELVNRRKDGRIYTSEQTIAPVLDTNGQVTHYISTQQDISERKENEQALQQRAIQLALLNDIGEQIIAVLDLAKIFQLAVKLVQESFGYHHVGIYMVDPQQELLVLQAKAGGFTDLFPENHTVKIGQGMVGWVVENNQILLSNDVASEPRYVNLISEKLSTHSELCVPIYISERVIGVLDAQSPSKNTFDDSDLIVMQTLAGQIAIAIENARLHSAVQKELNNHKHTDAELQRRANQLSALNQMGQVVTSSLDIDYVLEKVVDVVPPIVAAEGVSILLLENPKEFIFAAASGEGAKNLQEQMIPSDAGVAGQVLQTGTPVIINNQQNQKLFYREIEDISEYHTQSLLAVPLVLGNEIIGVMEAVHAQPNAFTNDDLQILEIASGWASIAISNARQHATTERQLKETQAIASINQALTETLDLNRLLQLMVDSISRIISQIERVVIHLYDEDNSTLIPAAVAGVALDRKPDLQMQSGQGIAGEVIKIGLPINVRDTQEDPRFIPIEGATYLRSLLVAPVQSGGRCLGTISVSSTVPNTFTNEDEALLTRIGVQASIALQNARLYAATNRRLAESNTLFYISNLIIESAIPDVEAILHQVVDQLWLDFGYYHVHVYLIDQESGELIANQGSGNIGKQLKEERYRFTSEEGIVGYAASVGEAFMSNNAADVLFFIPNPHLPHTSAEFAAPLRARDQILGVLNVHHQSPNTFDSDDFRFLTTVADQIAVVLDKALLYNQLQEALDKEQSTRAQLVQTEKLAAMGRLIASVAHELNNPLQAIQNAIYLVKLEENLSSQATEDLQVAFDEGIRMAGLIARLRDTYRPVVAADYQPESFDVLIEEVRKLLGTHLHHSNISLVFTPNPNLPKTLMIRDQIKQVILNLSINAIESMPEGGKLTFGSSYHPDLEEIHLDISDTGLGLAAEVQTKIFEPFFTTKESGTGLGLAVSYEIVQNHGGKIEAKNNPGPGATFTLILPKK